MSSIPLWQPSKTQCQSNAFPLVCFAAPKRKSDKSVKSNKKKRKVIYLDMKLDIIKWFDNGQRKASTGMALGLNELTV
jgi:hypothetical protein